MKPGFISQLLLQGRLNTHLKASVHPPDWWYTIELASGKAEQNESGTVINCNELYGMKLTRMNEMRYVLMMI